MLEQRVSITEGKEPLLLVAPSGPNDIYTDCLTEITAKKTNGYAVINWGWERTSNVDYLHDKADCNNTDHCRSVVYDEFLEPIHRFKNRIIRTTPRKEYESPVYHPIVYQFIIQGVCGNDLPPTVDLVVGAGSPHNPSCRDWVKKIFIYMACVEGLKTRLAKPGSVLSGSLKKNLNQLFSHDPRVQSVQLEVPLSFRRSKTDLDIFTDFLAKAIKHMPSITESQAKAILPSDFEPKIIS